MRTDAPRPRRSVQLVLLGLCLGLFAAPAARADVYPVAEGESIQAAVDLAGPGDTVSIGPGTFREQVVVTEDISIVGAGAATILEQPFFPPSVTTRADAVQRAPVIRITDAPGTVRISLLEIHPAYSFTSTSAILVQDSSATIDDVSVFEATQCDRECDGVLAENTLGATHEVKVTDSSMTSVTANFQGAGLTARIKRSSFSGVAYGTAPSASFLGVDVWEVQAGAFSSTNGGGIVAMSSLSGEVSDSSFDSVGNLGVVMDDFEGVSGDTFVASDNTFTAQRDTALATAGIADVTYVRNRVSSTREDPADWGVDVYDAETATITGNEILRAWKAVSLEHVAQATVRFNRFPPRPVGAFDTAFPIGVYVEGTDGPVDASDNFWGCNLGASDTRDCTHVVDTDGAGVTTVPYLKLSVHTVPGSIAPNQTADVIAEFKRNNGTDPFGSTLVEQDLAFTTTRGRLTDPRVTTTDRVATTALHVGSHEGVAHVRARLDHAVAVTDVTISAAGTEQAPSGADVDVSLSGDDGACSRHGSPCRTLQHAVDLATTGDVIAVGPGTFTEQVLIQKAVTVVGAGPSTILQIPGSPTSSASRVQVNTNYKPVVHVRDVAFGKVWLRDVTLSAGNAAGLLAEDSPMVIEGVTVSCSALAPCDGALFESRDFQGQEDTVRNSAFSQAPIAFWGNGITARIEGSTLSGDGTGPLVEITSVDAWHVEDSSFSDAQIAVDAHQSGAAEVLDSTFDAFGIWAVNLNQEGESLVASRNTFTSQTGEGIVTDRVDDVTITDNTITPVAGEEGAGLYLYKALSATITGNSIDATDTGVTLEDVGSSTVRFNRFAPFDAAGSHDGIVTTGTTGPVDATDNFWGCNLGPASPLCTQVTDDAVAGLTTAPFLVLGSSASPNTIGSSTTATITASLKKDNLGATVSPNRLPELGIAFSTTRGSLNHTSQTTSNHVAQAVLSSGAVDGNAAVGVRLDNATVTHTIAIDLTPPSTTIDSGPSGVTSDDTPSFTFSSDDPNATFECRLLPGGSWHACTSPEDIAQLDQGDWTFKVRAIDDLGNVDATPASRDFTVDTGAPVPSIDSGPTAITRDTTPTWSFSATDATAVTLACSVHLRSAPPSYAGCTSPYTSNALAEGDYAFSVRATDAASNVATAQVLFTLDTDDVTIVDHADGTSDAHGCGTTTDPCNTIQHGVDNAAAGDRVDVLAGAYDDGQTDVDKTLTIDGAGATTIVKVAPDSDGFRVLADDVVLRDLRITNQLGTTGTRGVVPGNTVTGTTLRNLTVDTLATGVLVRNQPTHPFVLRDSALSNLGTSLLGDGTHSNVSIHDNAFTGQTAVGTFTGSGTGFSFASNTMQFGVGSGLYFEDTANLTVTGNDFALFDVAFSLGGGNSNVTVSDNTIHDGSWQGVTINGSGNSGVAFTHNTVRNFSGALFQVASGSISGTLHIHRNRLLNSAPGIVDNGATIDATNNWWGCNGGPGSTGCPTVNGATDANPWLRLTATTPTATVKPSASTALQATVGKNSDGAAVANPFPQVPVSFSAGSGSFSPAAGTPSVSDGHLDTTWTAGAVNATLRASLDSATVNVPLTVSASAGDGGSASLPSGGHFETGNGVDATDRQDASVDLPAGTSGVVTLQESAVAGSGYSVPSGHGWMTTGFTITAPDPGAGNQLTLTFLAYMPGIPLNQVEIYRNGVQVSTGCPADPCRQSVTDLGGGVFRIVVKTRFASFWVVGGPDPTVVMLSGPNVSPASQFTNSSTPTFTYKTQVGGVDVPDASVTYACAIGAITNTCDPGTYTAASAVADGPRTFGVQAQVAGLAGPITNTGFFVDTVAPNPPGIAGPTQPYTASTGATFTLTTGDSAPSSGIEHSECRLDGGAWATCTSPIAYTGLSEGQHSFDARSVDNATNVGAPATYTWRIDLTDPVTTITGTKPGLDQGIAPQGAPTFATGSTTATFSYSATDPISNAVASGVANVRCSLDGGAFVACPVSYTGLAHGVHTFRVRATDNVGHVGPADSWTWFVDLRAPDITPTYPYPNARFNYFKPNDDVVATYTCDDRQVFPGPTESGVATCDGTVPFGSPFDRTSQGAPVDDMTPRVYPFQIDTTDKVGNAGTTSFSYRVFTFAGLVLDDAPEAYFRMNDPEGSPTLDDLSGNGNDGTYKNATESGPIGISGDNDTARVFTGADGYGFVNNLPAPHFGYTMSAFVQFSNDEDGMVMQHGHSGAIYRRGNAIVFHQTDDDVSLTVPGGIVPGCWYFVAGRWDGFQATVYAGTHDGPGECTGDAAKLRWFPPQSIASSSRPSGDGSTFYVGYGDQAQWLHGLLDEVAYFYDDIGATHVKELWLADPPPAVRRVLGAPAVANSLSKPPAVTPVGHKVSAKAAVRARVRALTKQVAKARATLRLLTRHHASKARVRAAQRKVAKLQRRLRAAQRGL